MIRAGRLWIMYQSKHQMTHESSAADPRPHSQLAYLHGLAHSNKRHSGSPTSKETSNICSKQILIAPRNVPTSRRLIPYRAAPRSNERIPDQIERAFQLLPAPHAPPPMSPVAHAPADFEFRETTEAPTDGIHHQEHTQKLKTPRGQVRTGQGKTRAAGRRTRNHPPTPHSFT